MTFFVLRHTRRLGLWYCAVNMLGALPRALVDDGFGELVPVDPDQCRASLRCAMEVV